MTLTMTCPRCGLDFTGIEPNELVDDIVEHAASAHRHQLDRDTVLAHLEGRHPHD